jgi:biotin carboxylase
MKKKAIVILGAGPQQIPAISRAHYLNYSVVCPDLKVDAEGLQMVEYPLPGVNTHDPEAIVEAILKLKRQGVNVSGIIAVAVEASHTVSKVAAEFGFNAVSIEVAFTSRNKIERLKCWKNAGVPCPDFGIAKNVNEAINTSERIGYPVVFKPIDLAGAKGVVIVNNKTEAREWFKYTFATNNTEVLIEEYVDGTEHSSESLVHKGEIHTTGFSDRNYDTKFLYPPHLLENGDTTPTFLSERVYKKTMKVIELAIKALGIETGAAKGDIIVTKDGKPFMLEMAARVSGDYFASYTAPLNNGTDLISALIQQAVGDDVNLDFLKWKFNKGVALRYCWPKPGKIMEISGIEETKSLQGVKFIKWEPYWANKKIGLGTVITKPTSHGERVVSILVSSESRGGAVKLSNYIVDKINIKTKME